MLHLVATRLRQGETALTRAHRRRKRWLGVGVIVLMLAGTAVGLILGGRGETQQLVATAETDAVFALTPPEIYKYQGFYDRIDDEVDELRADFVLKVPAGYIDRQTGDLQSVDGKQIRIGYDFSPSGLRSTMYINTMKGGAAGAESWAKNRDEYFTVHQVLPSGRFDFWVVSLQGDLNIPTGSQANNVPWGLKTGMNWYFSYVSGSPSTSTTWIRNALSQEEVHYYAYFGYRHEGKVYTGPQFKMQYDSKYDLWSKQQANWGQVLDFGLNGSPEGVLPANSFAVDLVNNGTRTSNPEQGAPGTVSDTFWYAWVHEDGSLVTSINTAPIKVTGVTPRAARNSTTAEVIKNTGQRNNEPWLGWTPEQGAQGLTNKVDPGGAVDFRDAGGNGYYRFLAWPESRDPQGRAAAQEADDTAPEARSQLKPPAEPVPPSEGESGARDGEEQPEPPSPGSGSEPSDQAESETAPDPDGQETDGDHAAEGSTGAEAEQESEQQAADANTPPEPAEEQIASADVPDGEANDEPDPAHENPGTDQPDSSDDAEEPEAEPAEPENNRMQSPVFSYTAADLFDANGYLTPRADAEKWTQATVYYKYTIEMPEAPVITVPEHNSFSNEAGVITLAGTGTPGYTISLRLASGATEITDPNDPGLTRIVDGEHQGVQDGDVVVSSDGTWSYEYRPANPLPDETYTVVALQTDQRPGMYHLTSPPSNPHTEETPSAWGVTFTIDTTAPDAMSFICPASPTTETAPRLSGSGVEEGAEVHVLESGSRVGEATVTGTDWSYTPEPPLNNGTYRFTAVQVDRAGNESAPSDPACELRVATAVPVVAEKQIVEVTHPAPELGTVSPGNWEITMDDGSGPVVINADADVRIPRDTEVRIAERLRTEPAPDPNADRYTQLGALRCVDGDGDDLPGSVFDPDAQTILIDATLDVPEPVSCSLRNQAAHASLVTKRAGGQTVSPRPGWSLTASTTASGHGFTLSEESASVLAAPGTVALAASAPAGLSVIGIQRLDTGREQCAAHATAPEAAPQDCWKTLAEDANGNTSITQGEHSVFRVVAASPAEVPSLPMTGGLGSWQFTVAGAVALALALATALRLRVLKRRESTATPAAPGEGSEP